MAQPGDRGRVTGSEPSPRYSARGARRVGAAGDGRGRGLFTELGREVTATQFARDSNARTSTPGRSKQPPPPERTRSPRRAWTLDPQSARAPSAGTPPPNRAMAEPTHLGPHCALITLTVAVTFVADGRKRKGFPQSAICLIPGASTPRRKTGPDGPFPPRSTHAREAALSRVADAPARDRPWEHARRADTPTRWRFGSRRTRRRIVVVRATLSE